MGGNQMLSRIGRIISSVAVALAGLGTAASAQDTITLKFSHGFPATHPLWEYGGKHFVDEVTAATNGRVKFEVYPAGQLGKDQLAALQSGLADVAILAAAYTPEKFPLSSVVDLPGYANSSCEGSSNLFGITQPGTKLYEAEYKAYGIRPLYAVQPPPYKLMTSSKRIESVADMAGLKVRAIGFAQTEMADAIGAVPVQIPAPELYEAISRGTIDGALFSYIGSKAGGEHEVLKHSVSNFIFGTTGVTYSISDRSWSALPSDVQAIMTQAGKNAQKYICEYYDKAEIEFRDEFVAAGHVLSELPAAEVEKATAALAEIEPKWLKSMQEVGRDGAGVLEGLKAIAASN
jgi:TRAP-type C4-dicarboxylate transport system substrate-binding protein